MAKMIAMIGAFDTKGSEYAFLRERLLEQGVGVLSINVGTLGTTELFPVDVEAEEIAEAGGIRLSEIRERQDRGEAMKAMAAGAPVVVARLYGEGKFILSTFRSRGVDARGCFCRLA